MSPYVIDQKKRQEYFLFLIFFTVLSFTLGYFFGYQNGQQFIEADIVQSPISEPESIAEDKDKKPQAALDASSEPHIKDQHIKKSAIKAVSKKIPVKKKQQTKPVTIKKIKPVSTAQVAKESIKEGGVAKTTKLKSAKPSQLKSPQAAALASIAPKTKNKVAALNSDASNANNENTSINDSAENTSAKPSRSYSVQVGMFASKPNAEKFINQLKDGGFDVYLGGFLSSSGIEKYNVRLGPYAKRELAKDNMSTYKQNYSTPAYIVINNKGAGN